MVEPINKQEKIVLHRREFIIKASLGFTFVVLGARLWNLQLINGDHYKKLSEENRIHLIPISGTRGLIYDKKNSLLAKNLISYDLVVIPDKHKDIRKIFQKVSSTLGIPYRSLLKILKSSKNACSTMDKNQRITKKKIFFIVLLEKRLISFCTDFNITNKIQF